MPTLPAIARDPFPSYHPHPPTPHPPPPPCLGEILVAAATTKNAPIGSLTGTAGQHSWTELFRTGQLIRTAGHDSWTEQLDRTADQDRWKELWDIRVTVGMDCWTGLLDRPAGQNRLG